MNVAPLELIVLCNVNLPPLDHLQGLHAAPTGKGRAAARSDSQLPGATAQNLVCRGMVILAGNQRSKQAQTAGFGRSVLAALPGVEDSTKSLRCAKQARPTSSRSGAGPV